MTPEGDPVPGQSPQQPLPSGSSAGPPARPDFVAEGQALLRRLDRALRSVLEVPLYEILVDALNDAYERGEVAGAGDRAELRALVLTVKQSMAQQAVAALEMYGHHLMGQPDECLFDDIRDLCACGFAVVLERWKAVANGQECSGKE